MKTFYGLAIETIKNDYLRLEVLAEAGPRIVGLYWAGLDDNLLAEVPEGFSDTVNGRYHFRGGHRLWHAPEQFNRTYVPDNSGLSFSRTEAGALLTQPTEAATGIRKQIEIALHPDRAAVTLTHRLTNEGVWGVELAPWAITQLRLGGTAVFPQQVGSIDPDGLLPNRNLILWPYTNLNDPRLRLGNDYILIKADVVDAPFKLGSFNRHGWLAYFWGNTLFCKRFGVQPSQPHPDMGCNAEIYINHQFIEMESLAPLCQLAPGNTVTHVETWELYSHVQHPTSAADLVWPWDDGRAN